MIILIPFVAREILGAKKTDSGQCKCRNQDLHEAWKLKKKKKIKHDMNTSRDRKILGYQVPSYEAEGQPHPHQPTFHYLIWTPEYLLAYDISLSDPALFG